MHCTKLCSHFQRSLTSVSIYGLRGDLMDYKTFSCEEPRCAPGECQLLRPAEKQREGWLYGNFLFSGSGNPFWNFLPGWPALGNGHVLQLECCCNYTHGLRCVSTYFVFCSFNPPGKNKCSPQPVPSSPQLAAANWVVVTWTCWSLTFAYALAWDSKKPHSHKSGGWTKYRNFILMAVKRKTFQWCHCKVR